MADYVNDVYLLNIERRTQFDELSEDEQSKLSAKVKRGFEILNSGRYPLDNDKIKSLIKSFIDSYLDTTKSGEIKGAEMREELLESTKWAFIGNRAVMAEKALATKLRRLSGGGSGALDADKKNRILHETDSDRESFL
jgi:hypothetical protein